MAEIQIGEQIIDIKSENELKESDLKLSEAQKSEFIKFYSVFASIPFIGLIVYFVDKKADDIVKNYAKQSNLLAIFIILIMVVQATPIAQVVGAFLWPVEFGLWLLLTFNAINQSNFQFPLIGKIFDNLFN